MFKDILPEQIIILLDELVDKLSDLTGSFLDSIKLLNEMRIGEARRKLRDTMKIESEADIVKKKIIALLEESRIDPGFKEDFFHLIKRIDSVADWIKEAARELIIIPYLEVPQPIREGIEKLIDKVVELAEKVNRAIKSTMSGEYGEAVELISEIEKLEEEADQINLENRGKLLEYSEQLKPITLALLVHDLNQDLEEAADSCEDVGDYLRALIASWKRI
ncbi:Putitive phosphate transport regulator [Staphylothermus hellenicus DSM 12710]|uniref:Putitive phosphate transport regulator n=1 Tax=Staphylothermus hellenicus (strain DSM 12710 / JCM 10830 / BK20S6-10-b1 / P8) TaxID=591019 RepID=D7D7Z8_STAHD|nr:Putitive phosphate transport regulator [Staphylothermus hellenicus DSM 12710]